MLSINDGFSLTISLTRCFKSSVSLVDAELLIGRCSVVSYCSVVVLLLVISSCSVFSMCSAVQLVEADC